MFRKLHSNRDPKDTLIKEFRKEFSPYIERCSNKITRNMQNHPKAVFYAMSILLLLSAGLSFTLFRNPEPKVKSASFPAKIIDQGFDQISKTAYAIRQSIKLKTEIDSLSAKPNLTKQDSETLEKDLDKLRSLNQHLTP